MKKTLILSCALALAGLSNGALAHDGAAGYLRGEVGNSDVSTDFGGDDGTSAIFSGGYWFNSNFAVEGHLGTLYTDEIAEDTDFDLVSIGAGIVAKHNFGPDGNGFFLAGRAGIARMTAQIREDFDVEQDDSSTKPYVGASAGYDFSQRFGLSLDFVRRQADFDGLDVDVDTVSVAGEFRF